MNPIPSPTQNNDKTDLLIAAVRHATTPELLESSAADYFGEEIVGPIFNAASLHVSALEEQKESDSLEPLDNPKGRTIKDLIRLLLADREVNVNVTDSTGWPLIFFAVQNLTVLKMLFEHRPELTESFSTIAAREPNNPASIIWDAFTWAAANGCIESLIFLANKLSEPAATIKKTEIIGWFLTKDLTQPSNQENFLAVLNAFAFPAAEINAFLLKAVNANAPLVIQTLLKAPNSDVNAVDDDGYTALMYAAERGQLTAIDALLKAGANVNAVDGFGRTALMWAAESGQLTAIDALLKAGADVNAVGGDGKTALMWAAYKGQADAVTTLCKAPGIDVDLVVNEKTALMYAAERGQLAAIDALLKAGADVNAVHGDGGWTALTLAAREGHTEAIKALLAADGIEVNVADRWGMTALMRAACWGLAEAIANLLQTRGIAVNATDANGRTALMLAATAGHAEAIKALLAASTLNLLLHSQASEAIALAKQNKHTRCVELIQTALRAAEAPLSQPVTLAQPQPVESPHAHADTLATATLLFRQPTTTSSALPAIPHHAALFTSAPGSPNTRRC